CTAHDDSRLYAARPQEFYAHRMNQDSAPSRLCIGRTVEDREIVMYGNCPLKGHGPAGGTLLIGGLHGDEVATVLLLEDFLARNLAADGLSTPTAILPLANPDAYERRSRYN